jgi:hypothetical protein
LRKSSVGPFGENAYAGGGAHEAVERLRISSDLTGELFRGFGNSIDEVRNPELRKARDRACDMTSIHDLEYADVSRQSLRLSAHS